VTVPDTVLVVNAGSSSLKLQVLSGRDEVRAETLVERWSGAEDISELERFLAAADHVDAVGHRVVHGGTRTESAVVDEALLADIDALSSLAPLHNPRAVAGIEAVGRVLAGVAQVACFDTAFHARMPAAAATYAVPAAWRDRHGVRRYGFHGLSHAYAARRAAQIVNRPLEELRIVTCHLGGGASLAAIAGGRSIDTTMGFTPLEGLVMATRSGSVDPGLVLWLIGSAGLTPDQVADGLVREGGLAGLSGVGGDLRDVNAAAAAGSMNAELAIEVYVHRLRREIAAMTAALGGLDLLVFTGGGGEHATWLRARAVEGLGFLGVDIDAHANAVTHADAEITAGGDPKGPPLAPLLASKSGSAPDGRIAGDYPGRHHGVRTVVVTAREDLEIARQVRLTLSS
jgi:acetate kinase